jgi:signal transduction histidine kinase
MPIFFENIPSEYFIYSVYGSTFLFLSFAIFIKDMKGSDLRLAESLWMLGMFGLTHGIHELMELYPLIEGARMSLHQLFQAELVSVLVLVVSFLFLLQFGVVLIGKGRSRERLWTMAIPAGLFLVWCIFLWVAGFRESMRFLGQAETGARYLFGLAGSLLTAYGLMAYSREIRMLSRSVSRHLWYAGAMFICYGIFTGVFVTRFAVIRLPFPIELLRAVSAMVITYFIIKALNIFNIETRRRIEQQTRHLVQTEKLTSLGQLAAGIAHEINNPLTNASLGIQTMKLRLAAQERGGELEKKLDAIERNIDKAAAIARELLQFSRQRESEFSPVNVNRVVRGALTLLEYKIKNIAVKQDLTEVPDVMGDAGKLEQVIINILSNAVEAMPGGGAITIETARSGAHVRIRIRDSGAGIPETHLSRVFDPFFTTKETGRGTGLGLSISYGIIKDHHGTIEVDSTGRQGTTVTILVPERKL